MTVYRFRPWPAVRRRFGEIIPPRARDVIAQREHEKWLLNRTTPRKSPA